MAIDGHFGLCRKKAAGKSVRPPLHNGVYFEDQTAVDAFVSGYSAGPAKKSKVGLDFQVMAIEGLLYYFRSVVSFLLVIL